jgi:UDP-2,3-diacylglucosamine pyrophosphatase LpxH
MPTTQMHVVLSDQHIPFQDPIIEDLTIEFLREHKPKVIHLLGDVLDFYSLSRFDKDPARKQSLQGELDGATAYFARLRDACPRARIIYSEGNHENRLRRYLWSQAQALSDLRTLSFEELLGLGKYKIEWVDASKPYRIGNLLFIHGELVRRASGASAKGHMDKFGCNVIHGHTHRLGAHYHRTFDTMIGAWENGCLCDLNPEYATCPDWQNGWSVVWFHGDIFHVEQVCVADNEYVYHGKLHKHRKRKRS